MSIERTLTEGLTAFNERQAATGRSPLSKLEQNMLALILTQSLAKEVGQLRDELESAASQSDLTTQRELEWAIDLIIMTIRADNKMSVRVTAEDVRKMSAGFDLRIDHDEGIIELEVVRNTKGDGSV